MFCIRKNRREDFTYLFRESWIRAKMSSETKYDVDTLVPIRVSSCQIRSYNTFVSTKGIYELLFQNLLKRPILFAQHDKVANTDFVRFFHIIC